MSGPDERPCVLLVDDDPGVLASLRRLLHDEPYDSLATTDPAEALEWIGRREIALLITDQRMPGMSGTDLVLKTRDRSPRTACVILTAYPDTAIIVEREQLRIERLVLKPWDDL